MPRKTEYQKQADKRTKDALRLRARCDARLRKSARHMLDALVGTAQAKARLDRINLLYGVDISTETLLAHDVRVAGLGEALATLLGDSSPGEEIQLFNPSQDAGSGPLEPEALFGEVANTPPVILPGGGVQVGT